MDRPERLSITTSEPPAEGAARDFTLRRGAHLYRLRADADSERELLSHIRRIARPDRPERRAA